jgi:hypothetical protein
MPPPAKQQELRSYTGRYLKDVRARSKQVESSSAMKLGKVKARALKREREAVE